MKYLLLAIVCASTPVLAEKEKAHHSILAGYGAVPIVGEAGFTTFQYEYIFDSNTGISLNYTDIEHEFNANEEYQVDVLTVKVTQYYQLSQHWSVYAAASYGQATPTFIIAEPYFDKESGYSYGLGFRHHVVANFYWGIGYEEYRMGDYKPPTDVNLSLSYRF